MLILPWIKLLWHFCSMWDKLWWLDWFWQYFCEELYSFNLKRFNYSYAWSCSLYERGLPFAQDLFIKNCRFLLMFSTGFTPLIVLLLFPQFIFFLFNSVPQFLNPPSSSTCTIFHSISSNMDEVLFINPSANVFVLGGFHSSPWFSIAFAPTIVYRNHFFVGTNTVNLLNLK